MTEPDLAPDVLDALTLDLADTVSHLRSIGIDRLPPIDQVRRIDVALEEAFIASGQPGDFDQARLMLAVCLHFLLENTEAQT
jgi:hypothetical protein